MTWIEAHFGCRIVQVGLLQSLGAFVLREQFRQNVKLLRLWTVTI
jgi:hypothetical protein